MPGFFDGRLSASDLQDQALKMYSTNAINKLCFGGDFRRGLRAIVTVILKKMSESMFRSVNASYQEETLKNSSDLLYHAEVAYQIAQDWYHHVGDVFTWHYNAALCYSLFLDWLPSSKDLCVSEQNKLIALIRPIVDKSVLSMVVLDRSRVEKILNKNSLSEFLRQSINIVLHPDRNEISSEGSSASTSPAAAQSRPVVPTPIRITPPPAVVPIFVDAAGPKWRISFKKRPDSWPEGMHNDKIFSFFYRHNPYPDPSLYLAESCQSLPR